MRRLFVRKITSIGAVGKGDNPAADIVLFKNKPVEKRNLTEHVRRVQDAWYADHPYVEGEPSSYVKTVHDLFAIIETGEQHFQVPYTTTDTDVTFGEPTPVIITETITVVKNPQSAKSADPNKEGNSMPRPDLSVLDDAVRKQIETYLDELEAGDVPAGEVLPELDPIVQKALDDKDEAIAKERTEREALQKQVDDMVNATADVKYAERADELGNILPGEDTADVLKTLATAAPEAFEKLDVMLGTASNAAKTSSLFKEFGSTNDESDPLTKILTIAKEIRKNEGDEFKTLKSAKAEAWRRNPDLKNQSREVA